MGIVYFKASLQADAYVLWGRTGQIIENYVNFSSKLILIARSFLGTYIWFRSLQKKAYQNKKITQKIKPKATKHFNKTESQFVDCRTWVESTI